MFSSGFSGGGSSNRYELGYPGSRRYHSTQEERIKAQRAIDAENQARIKLIKEAASSMVYHPERVKTILEEAATAYLKKIEELWFRRDGRKRAEEFITKLSETKTTSQLIHTLNEVIQVGNEDSDSLKTFIFNHINLHFCDKKLENTNFAFQIQKILTEMTELESRREKISLCYLGFFNTKSNFNRLPIDLIREISTKLYNS